MVEGRRTSSPLSRRAPADLDVLVLTDPRTGVLAVLSHWAGRIRWGRGIEGGKFRTRAVEAALIRDNWDWAMRQPWGGKMYVELEALASRLHEHRYGVPLRPCPVCGELVRLDRFVTEHRECIDTPVYSNHHGSDKRSDGCEPPRSS
jgi:hypothetical protein